MADQVETPTQAPRPLHPKGIRFSRCVDVLDLGEKLKRAVAGKPEKLQRRVAFVFRTGEKNPETGMFMELSKEFALSMFKGKGGTGAPLRLFLEQWTGEPYAEADPVVQLAEFEGRTGTLNVIHEPNEREPGKFFANIGSVTPLPPGIVVPEYGVYTRAPYWAERKEKYAKEAAEFRAKNPPAKVEGLPAVDSDSEIPF